jgi:NAD(P)-dependent dehydrogenase (short-subunit alcohol dehydrogenase family)
MSDLTGKSIVVTGAGGNLGGCMAMLLASRGARLTLSDINKVSLAKRRDLILQQGGEAQAHVADVTREGDLQALMDAAVAAFGGLDVLVNNAGLIGQENAIGVLDVPAELWDRTLDINLKSVFLASKCALPHLVRRGGGAIINISSDSSVTGNLAMTAYAASKAGVNTLTRYIAAQHGKDNVRCNAVLPGIHLSEEAIARTPPESLQQMADHCLLPRLGVPEDIAKLVAFLASDDAFYITAQLIQVDGGLLHHVPHLAETRRSGPIYQSALKAP